jgi:nucleotide-binding universal stress UspA family protein
MHAPATIRLDHIVTGIDFHDSSRDAALWVLRHLAPDAAHELVHVVEIPELPAPLRGLGNNREQLRIAARSGAQHRLEDLREHAASAQVEIHVREGKPAAELLRLAEEVAADLVVVGEQGPTRGIGALLGSTAERVLLHSNVPVLLARKVSSHPPRRLLVAIDPSDVTDHILASASALLTRFDATAVVLNVVDRLILFDELYALPDATTFQRMVDSATVAMEAWLDERLRATGLPESRMQAKVLVGNPSYEITAEAARQGADLILVGSKGGDIARTPLTGRILNKVVRNSPCSVLVLTPPGV